MEDRVRLFRADLFDGLPGPYGIILANPPYVPSARIEKLPAEYGHEPVLALNGGRSGLELVDRLVAGAADRLTPDGLLIVEVGEVQAEFRSRHRDLPATWLEFERGGGGVFLLTREELTGLLGACTAGSWRQQALSESTLRTGPLPSRRRRAEIGIMAGDTFGKLFTVTTFGESHGPAMGGVVDGCPPGMALREADIQVGSRPAAALGARGTSPNARNPTGSGSCPVCSKG